MVRAILDGRKTATRRVIKLKYDNTHIEIRHDKYGKSVIELQNQVEGETFGINPDGTRFQKLLGAVNKKPPFKPGNILYVRETWQKHADGKQYLYLADYSSKEYATACLGSAFKWHPSIHMPKEAARIFLRVIDVRVERLQDIDDDGAKAEGANYRNGKNIGWEEKIRRSAIERFKEIWNSTIPKKQLDEYGWDANPWVWVIEFERMEIPI